MVNEYTANNESLKQHQVPDWYHDAKFGIFIHWSISSIPAFAPANTNINELVKTHGQAALFSHSPYAEWYLNSLRINDSPVQQHHASTYGESYDYANFASAFNQQIMHWDPDQWAKLFAEIHARYVVLVTKHHDGFLLWPSATKNPNIDGWNASRNVVKELTESVRSQGLKMGYYYSGALDWSFTEKPITSLSTMMTNGPTSTSYARYCEQHYRELIDTYAPEVLWNDIAYPARGNLKSLLAYYYNKVQNGVINDRWQQISPMINWLLKIPPLRKRIEREIAASFTSGSMPIPKNIHTDYSTPEYSTLKEISTRKWECVRGIGHSFGYNSTEADKNFLTGKQLIALLVDIVSKNGNLLLNIGPKADGSIPAQQLKPLLELGEWLGTYGEAIFATRPWVRSDCVTPGANSVHFTQNDQYIYLISFGLTSGQSLQVPEFVPSANAKACWLSTGQPLDWQMTGNFCEINLPAQIEPASAHVLRFTS